MQPLRYVTNALHTTDIFNDHCYNQVSFLNYRVRKASTELGGMLDRGVSFVFTDVSAPPSSVFENNWHGVRQFTPETVYFCLFFDFLSKHTQSVPN